MLNVQHTHIEYLCLLFFCSFNERVIFLFVNVYKYSQMVLQFIGCFLKIFLLIIHLEQSQFKKGKSENKYYMTNIISNFNRYSLFIDVFICFRVDQV